MEFWPKEFLLSGGCCCWYDFYNSKLCIPSSTTTSLDLYVWKIAIMHNFMTRETRKSLFTRRIMFPQLFLFLFVMNLERIIMRGSRSMVKLPMEFLINTMFPLKKYALLRIVTPYLRLSQIGTEFHGFFSVPLNGSKLFDKNGAVMAHW